MWTVSWLETDGAVVTRNRFGNGDKQVCAVVDGEGGGGGLTGGWFISAIR
jgi:hypothetical protein